MTSGGDDCLRLQLDQLRHVVVADAPGEKVMDQQAGHLAQEVELLEGGVDVGDVGMRIRRYLSYILPPDFQMYSTKHRFVSRSLSCSMIFGDRF